MFRLFCANMVVVVLLFAGCGPSGPERVNVTGTLTYNGKPVEDGALEIIPKTGTNAPMQPVTVRDGTFSATGEHGFIVGEYQVVFHAYDRRAPTSAEQAGDGPPIPEMMRLVEMLPKKYSTEASTETLSLKSGDGSKTVAFDLKP